MPETSAPEQSALKSGPQIHKDGVGKANSTSVNCGQCWNCFATQRKNQMSGLDLKIEISRAPCPTEGRRQSCLLSFSFTVMWEAHKTRNCFNPKSKEISLVMQPRQKEVWEKKPWPTGVQMWSLPPFCTFAQPRDHHISVQIFHLLMPCFPRNFINSVMKCSHLAHSTLPKGKGEGKLEPRMQSKSSIFLGMILQALQWKEHHDVFPTFATSLNHSWPPGIAICTREKLFAPRNRDVESQRDLLEKLCAPGQSNLFL